jgi:hypothetical protein
MKRKADSVYICLVAFLSETVLEKGSALETIMFILASEYAIRKVQGRQEGLKLNGTNQLVDDAEDATIGEKAKGKETTRKTKM